ncbi:MAG: transcriptional regulator, GntR family [Candidatus Aminicenantes bacterium]|nr:transcriptional regulator, GntR family [Candidatus Aminicenantes bacterium]
MQNKPLLNVKSLKEQVYELLRVQLHNGSILPGSELDLEETSKKLGVSRTPLREALLQLEIEGFVTILPRRKVVVNVLSLQEIKSYYEIIGALESTALLAAFDRIKEGHIRDMEKLNAAMEKAIEKADFDLYYEKNLSFHNVFLDRCGNENLIQIAQTLKKRLYDFPRQKAFVKAWEEALIGEHRAFVELIKQGRRDEAAAYIRDVHWSFKVQKKYVHMYYAKASKAIK